MNVFKLTINHNLFYLSAKRLVVQAPPIRHNFRTYTVFTAAMAASSWKRKSIAAGHFQDHLNLILEDGKLAGKKSLIFELTGLVRFVPKDDSSKVLIGQPTDNETDVGVALREGKEVTVDVFDGSSILSPGKSTGKNVAIDRVLSPLTPVEAGTIRCIGLNVRAPIHTELSARSWLPAL